MSTQVRLPNNKELSIKKALESCNSKTHFFLIDGNIQNYCGTKLNLVYVTRALEKAKDQAYGPSTLEDIKDILIHQLSAQLRRLTYRITDINATNETDYIKFKKESR